MLSFEEFSFPVRCVSKPENCMKQSVKRWWKEEFSDAAVKKTYTDSEYLDQPITEKSCSLALLKIQSTRRPESGTPTKHQSTKIYHKVSQIKRSEILHLVKTKSLEDPHFQFGFKGRGLQLFAFSFHPLPPAERWQLVAALPKAGDNGGEQRVHISPSTSHPEPWRGRCARRTRAVFPVTPISEAFVQKLQRGFREPPPGTCRVQRGENNVCSFSPHRRHGQEESSSLLDPEKQSGGFLGVTASRVTWGWCAHELSTTLVQISELNIGPGHCQLGSVTWTLRGSSHGQHPFLLLPGTSATATHTSRVAGGSIPAPPWRLVMLSRLPCSPAQAARQSKSCLARWLFPAGTYLTRLEHRRGVFRLLEPQLFLCQGGDGISKAPEPRHPGHSSLLLKSPYLRNCSEIWYRKPQFCTNLSENWTLEKTQMTRENKYTGK